LSIEWLRDGIGNDAEEVAKYRSVSVAEVEMARIAEDAPPDAREALLMVFKHGTSRDHAELYSKARELAHKIARARQVLRGSESKSPGPNPSVSK
jgi:hypothetical protein